MTTLAEAKTKLLPQYTPKNCPDRAYGEKMIAQFNAMTKGKHPYHTYFNFLSEGDRRLYGSMGGHPDGYEACFTYWQLTGAGERWSNDWQFHCEEKYAQAA